jgi:hypothetical protein
MKTIKITTPDDVSVGGRGTKITDDQGNDISRFVSKATFIMDTRGVNRAHLEVLASGEITAVLEGVNLIHTCPRCLEVDRQNYEREQSGKPSNCNACGWLIQPGAEFHLCQGKADQ